MTCQANSTAKHAQSHIEVGSELHNKIAYILWHYLIHNIAAPAIPD